MRTAAACWTTAAAILISAILTGEDGMCRGLELVLPANHTALSGDLEVRLSGGTAGGTLKLLRSTGQRHFEPVVAVNLEPNTSLASFPCGVITTGGRYRVDFVQQNEDVVSMELDVRWPPPHFSLLPEQTHTYPETPVKGALEFLTPTCKVAAGSVVPELWLELRYTGQHNPDPEHYQVLYSEQVRGYPRRRDITFKCELFGLAGLYVLTIRSPLPTEVPVMADAKPAHIKVSVSDRFVFNVHGGLTPCEPGGVAVLFQYPHCVLPGADRVRLFGRLRADVASLVPPTSLHYVTEKKVPPGAHSLTFSCDLFTERYVEYCFVYVNEAITGAVTDVRMDCVPTLPIGDSDAGSWGAWSAWTPCTSSCGIGTRVRYRFCDSPPPKYGARFCEGPSLESEQCGAKPSSWGCLLAAGSSPTAEGLAPDHPQVVAEIGPGCRCGCVVHLGVAKPKRLIATSTVSCPGRTFWLIQADTGYIVRLSMEQFRLPCGRQWVKVRDGDSLGSTMIAQLEGRLRHTSNVVTSTGNVLLLEFFSDPLLVSPDCLGSFLAHAQQIEPPPKNVSVPLPGSEFAEEISPRSSRGDVPLAVHAAAALFVGVVLLVTAGLAAQSLLRYRKYQRAAAERDEDSSDCSSDHSDLLPGGQHKVESRSTLLSEVISLHRLHHRNNHSRLHDSEEESDDNSEPEYEVINTGSGSGGGGTKVCEASDDHSTAIMVAEQDTTMQPCTPRVSPAPKTYHKPDMDEKSLTSPSPPQPNQHHSSTSGHSLPERKHSRRRQSKNVPGSVTTSSSAATTTNGWPSPNGSTARITTPKERKERRNLERLLAGGGTASELSLATANGDTTDLELDYYDYNVSNAGAVPGSFLGMDPAYLVWIPPLDPDLLDEITGPVKTSPSECSSNRSNHSRRRRRSSSSNNRKSEEALEMIPRGASSGKLNGYSICKSPSVEDGCLGRPSVRHAIGKRNHEEVIELLPRVKADTTEHSYEKEDLSSDENTKEKETRVEKSPSEDYDDIKFADEDEAEDDEEEIQGKQLHHLVASVPSSMRGRDVVVIIENSNRERHISA